MMPARPECRRLKMKCDREGMKAQQLLCPPIHVPKTGNVLQFRVQTVSGDTGVNIVFQPRPTQNNRGSSYPNT